MKSRQATLRGMGLLGVLGLLVGIGVYFGFFYERRVERHEVRTVGLEFLRALETGDDEKASEFLANAMKANCDINKALNHFRIRIAQLSATDSQLRPLQVDDVQVIELTEKWAISRTWFRTVDGQGVGDSAPLEYIKEPDGVWRIASLLPRAEQFGCSAP